MSEKCATCKRGREKSLWEKFCEFDDRMSQPAFEFHMSREQVVDCGKNTAEMMKAENQARMIDLMESKLELENRQLKQKLMLMEQRIRQLEHK